jgi:hypothetical protein
MYVFPVAQYVVVELLGNNWTVQGEVLTRSVEPPLGQEGAPARGTLCCNNEQLNSGISASGDRRRSPCLDG